MARAIWLAAVLRRAGLHVIEMDGWQTRETRAGFDPRGIVWHHTATPRSASDLAVRRLLRDGRPDLKGPLCQLGLERDGTYVVVAAGRANHAGYGTPWGNDSIGIEAYNNGRGEPWPQVQMDAYDVGTAALLTALGLDASRVKAHREVDPTRKIDPLNVDMGAARRRIAVLLNTQPTPIGEDDRMFFAQRGNDETVWFFEPGRMTHVPTRADVNALAKAADIPATEAVLSATFFDRLAKGRTRIA